MNKKILIVDDEEDMAKVVAKRLVQQGFNVDTAFNGKDGLMKAKRDLPDLIILDIMMPGMHGNEVAAVLKLDPSTKNIPIIFLSALLEKEEEISKGNQIPGILILAKPYEIEVLLKKISQLI